MAKIKGPGFWAVKKFKILIKFNTDWSCTVSRLVILAQNDIIDAHGWSYKNNFMWCTLLHLYNCTFLRIFSHFCAHVHLHSRGRGWHSDTSWSFFKLEELQIFLNKIEELQIFLKKLKNCKYFWKKLKSCKYFEKKYTFTRASGERKDANFLVRFWNLKSCKVFVKNYTSTRSSGVCKNAQESAIFGEAVKTRSKKV